MTLKKCSCGFVITTKNAVSVRRKLHLRQCVPKDVLWFTCPKCLSTMAHVREIPLYGEKAHKSLDFRVGKEIAAAQRELERGLSITLGSKFSFTKGKEK